MSISKSFDAYRLSLFLLLNARCGAYPHCMQGVEPEERETAVCLVFRNF